jgi:predicted Zn-dependent protease
MQESEADHIGVFLMAFAGYQPTAAVEFWQQMEAATGARGGPPEFLSDHPSHATRIRQLRKWSVDARKAKIAFDQGRIAASR